MSFDDKTISSIPMEELFRVELEQQSVVLTNGLLNLEKGGVADDEVASMMRAAHSIKGAARLVGRDLIVKLAHALEDCFTQIQGSDARLTEEQVDILLRAADLIVRVGMESESDDSWLAVNEKVYVEVTALLEGLTQAVESRGIQESSVDEPEGREHIPTKGMRRAEDREENRVLRLSPRQLDRLMALAGESMIQSRWLGPFADSLRRLKKEESAAVHALEELREQLRGQEGMEVITQQLGDLQQKLVEIRDSVDERVLELDSFNARVESLSHRLQSALIASRMRPFADGVGGLPRIVRDVAKSLGKRVDIEITGEKTRVDRDVLERIEAPLIHLVNNAVDHGIELPDERVAAGKPEKGFIRLNAYHRGGMLYITLEDDGRGIDFDRLRDKVVKKGLVTAELAPQLSKSELTEFLFLPGFSTRDTVTALSGRGVGLDVVHGTLQELRGSIRAENKQGEPGLRFTMRLPVTLSVIPSLVAEVGAEPYAVPLAAIKRILRINASELVTTDGMQTCEVDGETVTLVSAAAVLEVPENLQRSRQVSILVMRDAQGLIGFIVDRFDVQRDLVVHVMPPQLGKLKDVSAAALLEDGSPALIIDVEDFLRSGRRTLEQRQQLLVDEERPARGDSPKKRVLVVDDSLTVRELERKLLVNAGYEVDVAVDGMEGWNAVRNQVYDLVVTDVDMPRLNGYQLVRMIKRDDQLKEMPVIVVTYKDRVQDETRAYAAGADYFLAKAHFQDDALRHAVEQLIGT